MTSVTPGAIFSDIIGLRVVNVKLCRLVVHIELFTFIPLLATMTVGPRSLQYKIVAKMWT